MLDFFKQLSLKRSSWIFLAFSTFALESTALYFQYGMGLQPCVLCVRTFSYGRVIYCWFYRRLSP